MKKITILFILMLSLLLCLVGCGCANEGDTYEKDNEREENNGNNESHTHSFSEWQITKEPDCTAYGEEQRKCLCGQTETRKIEKLSHTRGSAVKENEVLPTCQKEGSYEAVVYCTVCKQKVDVETVAIEKNAHKPSILRATDEYCNSVNVTDVYCGVCEEYITSYGHKYEETSVMPTCTNEGYITKYCYDCGKSQVQYLDPYGHVASGWETEIVATCCNVGYAVKECLYCQKMLEKKQLQEISHNYTVIREDSALKYTCTVCGDSYKETVYGNIYKVTFVSNGGTNCQEIYVEEGKAVSLPTPQKAGRFFDGWYVDSELTEKYSGGGVYKDFTLYALWKDSENINKDDNAIVTSVETNYVFNIVWTGKGAADNIENYIAVYDLKDNKVNIKITDNKNGTYTVASEGYESSSFYYAVVKDPVRFADTEKMEKQFTINGVNSTNIQLNENVKYLEKGEIYGIVEAENNKCILTKAEFSVGDNVAIYEEDLDNVCLVVNIQSKGELIGYYCYEIKQADYKEVFDTFEASVLTSVNFDNFQVSPSAIRELEAQILSSPFYAQAKNAAVLLSEDDKISLEKEDIRFVKKNNTGCLSVEFVIVFEYSNGFKIEITIGIELGAECEAYFNSIDNYALVETLTQKTQIKIDATYGIDGEKLFGTEEETLFSGEKNYGDLLGKYKAALKDSAIKELPAEKLEQPKTVELGEVNFPTASTVVLGVKVNLKLDFLYTGAIKADINFLTVTKIGVKNNEYISSSDTVLTESGLYAFMQVEFCPMLEVELSVNFHGLTVYGNANVGPYFDACVAGVVVYDGQNLLMPSGSAYLEFGVKFGVTIGVKYEIEIWGTEHKLFDLNKELITQKTPKMEYGVKEIALYFVEKETTQTIERECDQKEVFDLSQVSTVLKVFDLQEQSMKEEKKHCDFVISEVSGYASSIYIKENKLIFENVGQDVTLKIKVKYNDLIEKEIELIVKTANEDDSGQDKTDSSGYTLTGDGKIMFGSYPQSRVENKSLISALNAKAGDLPYDGHPQAWKEKVRCYLNNDETVTEKCYWYIDLEYKGEKYRGIVLNSYSSIQQNNGYTSGKAYWFKYEPVLWRILATKDGKAIVICDTVIDVQHYQSKIEEKNGSYYIKGTSTYANNYEYSTIRAWLNDSFYNTAFSQLQQKLILTANVDNSDKSMGGHDPLDFSSNNTKDKIFLLSLVEAAGSMSSEERKRETTDYALIQDVGGQCENWWTRSPYYAFSDTAIVVEQDGGIGVYGMMGVVPALWIKLNGSADNDEAESKDEVASDGLELTLSADGDYYTVAGIGKCKDVNVVIPSVYNGLPVTSIGERAFANCTGVMSITIPNSVTNIGFCAFFSCCNLTDVTIPDSVTKIGDYAFYSCDSLTSITIGNSVTSIGPQAFAYCDGLTSVIIPSSVTSIGKYAFRGEYHPDLTIYCEATSKPNGWDRAWNDLKCPVVWGYKG